MTLNVSATGVNLATGAASVNSPLPPDAAGNVPRRVRIAATAAAHVRIGVAGLAAVATDLLVQPADHVIVGVPRGLTHVAAIQDTAAGTVTVTPLEG